MRTLFTCSLNREKRREQEPMVLRVKPTPTWFSTISLQTGKGNTPLHSISNVGHPWDDCRPSGHLNNMLAFFKKSENMFFLFCFLFNYTIHLVKLHFGIQARLTFNWFYLPKHNSALRVCSVHSPSTQAGNECLIRLTGVFLNPKLLSAFFLPLQRNMCTFPIYGQFVVFTRDHLPTEYWTRNGVHTHVNFLCSFLRYVTAALYLPKLRYLFNLFASRQITQTRKH